MCLCSANFHQEAEHHTSTEPLSRSRSASMHPIPHSQVTVFRFYFLHGTIRVVPHLTYAASYACMFCVWLLSFEIMFVKCIHVVRFVSNSFFLLSCSPCWNMLLCLSILLLMDTKSIPVSCVYEWSYYERSCTHIFVTMYCHPFCDCLGLLGHWVLECLFL